MRLPRQPACASLPGTRCASLPRTHRRRSPPPTLPPSPPGTGLPDFTAGWWFPLYEAGAQLELAILVCLVDIVESTSIARALAQQNKYILNNTQARRARAAARHAGREGGGRGRAPAAAGVAVTPPVTRARTASHP